MTTAQSLGTMPLQPIEPDFEEKTQLTIDQLPAIEKSVDEVVGDGLRNVFLVGAGGSMIASYPAFYALLARCELPVFQVQSDELNTTQPAHLGKGSLVIVASYTGTTKETVAAARYAKQAGATVLSFCKPDSPLAHTSTVDFTGSSDIGEFLVAIALLQRLGAAGDFDLTYAAVRALPHALLHAQQESEPHLAKIAASLKDEPITYVLGSGAGYAQAYCFAMCYLQEMQWKHAAAFNAGEFFQGAMEVVQPDVPVLLLLGEDASRPMAERARRFLDQHTRRAWYVDTADLELPGVPQAARGEVSAFALRVLISRLARQYEAQRGHSLDGRRYMFRIEY